MSHDYGSDPHGDGYARDDYGRIVLDHESTHDGFHDALQDGAILHDVHDAFEHVHVTDASPHGGVPAVGTPVEEEDVDDAFRRYEHEAAAGLDVAAPAVPSGHEDAFYDVAEPHEPYGTVHEPQEPWSSAPYAVELHEEPVLEPTPQPATIPLIHEEVNDGQEEHRATADQDHLEPAHLVEVGETPTFTANDGQTEANNGVSGEPLNETIDTTKPIATLQELMALETNYPIPYRSKLTEPFEPGQTLIIKGKTAEDSVRFTVSLHTATADFSGNDVPLHLSIRFDEGKIVFNTFSKGEWGKEERKSNPWKKGDDIDIRVRAHDSKFTIFADQKEIKEFEHRVPLSSVTHFSIDGDVFVTHIHWGGKYYPVPYESGIPGDGLAPGKTLLIFGTPEKKGKRFHINLLKKNGDIAIHFNPRFDEKAIVRNSLISGEWGNEEREGKIHLEKGVGFDLKIVNEEYAFQVFINDERFCTYAHRLEPHDLHGLQIGGDVEITGIQIF